LVVEILRHSELNPFFQLPCNTAGMQEPISPERAAGLRQMSAAAKLEMVCDLYHAGIALRVAGLKLRYPDWPKQKLEFEAKRSLRHAGT
jgi:hypothetical protein